MSATARRKALEGEEEMVLTASGGLTAKGLSRREKKSLRLENWLAAARLAEDLTLIHHGARRTDALADHQRLLSPVKLGRNASSCLHSICKLNTNTS